MTIEKMRVLAEKNILGIPNIIYLRGDNLKDVGKAYEDICEELNIEGKVYSINEDYVCLTYNREEISEYIIKSVLEGKEKDEILEEGREKVKMDIFFSLREFLKERETPYINIDDENIQIGYGEKGIIINKDNYKESQDIEKLNKIEIIPIIAVTGTNGKTTTSRLIHKTLMELGYKSGLSSTGGVFIGDKAIRLGDTTGYLSALEVLKNREVNAAVLETARGGIIKKGLGFKKAKAGIITSLSEDHIGLDGVNSLEELGKIKALIKEGLDTDGKMVVRAIKEIVDLFKNPNSLILFENDKNELIEKHIKSGGEAIYEEDGYIILNSNGKEEKLVRCDELEFAHFGVSKSNIRNIMAAIGAIKTFHSDLNETINAIKDFKCDMETNKGRQNILEINNFKLIIDYGHNSEAFHEVFSIAKSLKPSRLTGVITAPGDRKDSYIVELGEVAAKYCDFIVIKEHEDKRGRKTSETSKLLYNGVKNTGFKEENIKILLREEDALLYVLENAKENEIIVSFSQFLNQTLPVLNDFIEKSKAKI